MIIIGAGLTGLIAGHFFRGARIQERQLSLPNNHHALLRFRTDAVSKLTGIPFKKGLVRKNIIMDGVFSYGVNPYLANMYSQKVTGKISDRSIWNLDADTRYIAPPNFVELMAKNLKIDFGKEKLGIINSDGAPIISTIPMPLLMEMSSWKNVPKFEFRPIWSVQIDLIDPEVDVFQTIYYPSNDDPEYRASISGKRFIAEFINKPEDDSCILRMLTDFGIINPHWEGDITFIKHPYGKIIPIDEDLRQEFIYTMTRDHNIYSIGRFATWRQILLDDIVKDCEIIQRLIMSETGRRKYSQRLKTGG